MSKRVSVSITTYNQEKYIAQAVESALNQRVNFDYEIVIGEDCSTDRTRQIVVALKDAHPEKIRLLLHDKNLGRWGKFNFVETLKACRGEYIALLDGDDYWTDPNKLQRQVDFLESHPECSICFHDVTLLYEDGTPAGRSGVTSKKDIFTIEDLLTGNFMFACSVMFCRGLFGDFPDWFYNSKMGDWSLHLINAQYGKIGYLKEVMAVYRVHPGGFWTSQNPLGQAKDQTQIMDHLVNELDDKYKKKARAARANSYQYLSEVYFQQNDIANARRSLLKSLRICLSNKSIPNRQLLGRLVKLQTYSSYEWLRLRFTRVVS
jgi:glycosyltransferase involved in cell wall biosynthesis